MKSSKRMKTENEIIELLKNEGPLTLKEIAQKLNLSIYWAEIILKKLTNEGKLTKTTFTVYKIRK